MIIYSHSIRGLSKKNKQKKRNVYGSKFDKALFKGIQTISANVNISQAILSHLRNKRDHQDDLDGLLILIYDREIKNLSEEVFKTISKLLSGGKLEEKRSEDGKVYYRLRKSENNVPEIL